MSTSSEGRQARAIDELRVFIRKVLSDPTVAVKCMEIARKHRGKPDAEKLMAEEISATTIVRIPENWSEADKMFLEILGDVMDDEEALY
ncbi:hypothetical protein [uncultured Marinobacter sp.]|uniref:hypothetical protein n=1 Tax=uncultured Marinobacter sp. TaxID=187379 RepID=UPI0030D9BCF9|tara:strand:- start:158 stop:424 length:267 start_codon:yes stop_codon:yes gene_type:complete